MSMNATELVTFAREMLVCGAPPALSERGIKNLFAWCQQEEEDVDEDENEAETQSSSEQVYSEFMETNSAIGCQLKPDPYNVVEIRLDQYLNESIHPVALKNKRFRGRGLRDPKKLKELWMKKQAEAKEKEEAEGCI